MLLKAGVERCDDERVVRMIEAGRPGEKKWCGGCVYGDRIFFAPNNHDSVLTLDTRTRKVGYIDTGATIIGGFEDICECGGRLFCPPWSAPHVLVVNPADDTLKRIEIPEDFAAAGNKWPAAALCEWDGKIYCPPGEGSHVLVIDPETDELDCIDTKEEEITGYTSNDVRKWDGVCAFNGKLYCAPSSHQSVLVIDPAAEDENDKCTFIDTEDQSEFKFSGIAELNGLLYCCPLSASYVLRIDPGDDEREPELHRIEVGVRRPDKWSGIAACDGRLYCAPCNESAVLVIDPEADTPVTVETGESTTGNDRWDGITEADGKLYCTPSDMTSILVVTTRAKFFEELGLGL